MTKPQAGQAYLAAVGPYNEAWDRFEKQAAGWTDSTTANEVQAAADPVAKAARGYQAEVLALAKSYPPATADLKALVTSPGKTSSAAGSVAKFEHEVPVKRVTPDCS